MRLHHTDPEARYWEVWVQRRRPQLEPWAHLAIRETLGIWPAEGEWTKPVKMNLCVLADDEAQVFQILATGPDSPEWRWTGIGYPEPVPVEQSKFGGLVLTLTDYRVEFRRVESGSEGKNHQ